MHDVDTRLVFVLPDCHVELSGGHRFNAGLLQGLKATGDVGVCTWSESKAEGGRPGWYIVDSLNLADFDATGPTARQARDAGQRFVLLVHHLPSLEPGAKADLAWQARALARFDAFIVTSAFTKSYLQDMGCTQSVSVIEPVLDMLVRRQGGAHWPLRALMSCNLIARKGVLEFLEGLAEATGPEDRYTLSIVGRSDMDRDYSDACAKRISSCSELRTRVSLEGAVDYADMPHCYQQANLFVSASAMETFGIALQEARWFALPILAVRGGNSGNHVRENVTGDLYSTAKALAQGFLALTRNAEQMHQYAQGAEEFRLEPTETWNAAALRLRSALEQVA